MSRTFRFFISVFSLFLLTIPLFAQDDAEENKEPEITVITINNARQSSYKKNEETGNDCIVQSGIYYFKDSLSGTVTASDTNELGNIEFKLGETVVQPAITN